MKREDPERMIRKMFRFIDKPVRDEPDVADVVEREETAARRKERDADFEVVDDLDGVDDEIEDILEGGI